VTAVLWSYEIIEVDETQCGPRWNYQRQKLLRKDMEKESRQTGPHDIRTRVLRRRYLWKDADGRVVETVDQMYRRVAEHIASAESKYVTSKAQVKEWAEKFYVAMKNGKFLPNSPTLMNAGRKQGMLRTCK